MKKKLLDQFIDEKFIIQDTHRHACTFTLNCLRLIMDHAAKMDPGWIQEEMFT